VPVWFEPQPLATNAHQDLGDDERGRALIRKSLGQGRRTHFRLPYSRSSMTFESELQQSKLIHGQLSFADT